MRTLDGTGLAKRGVGGPSGGGRRGSLAAAGAAAPDFSAQTLLARLALQEAVLTGADGGAGDELGRAVAFSGDTALVGAPGHDHGTKTDRGATYVYARSGAMWIQEQIMIADVAVATEKLGASSIAASCTAPRRYILLRAYVS